MRQEARSNQPCLSAWDVETKDGVWGTGRNATSRTTGRTRRRTSQDLPLRSSRKACVVSFPGMGTWFHATDINVSSRVVPTFVKVNRTQGWQLAINRHITHRTPASSGGDESIQPKAHRALREMHSQFSDRTRFLMRVEFVLSLLKSPYHSLIGPEPGF